MLEVLLLLLLLNVFVNGPICRHNMTNCETNRWLSSSSSFVVFILMKIHSFHWCQFWVSLSLMKAPVDVELDVLILTCWYVAGVGKGLVGVFTRPASGVVDFASSSFEGIRRYCDMACNLLEWLILLVTSSACLVAYVSFHSELWPVLHSVLYVEWLRVCQAVWGTHRQTL